MKFPVLNASALLLCLSAAGCAVDTLDEPGDTEPVAAMQQQVVGVASLTGSDKSKSLTEPGRLAAEQAGKDETKLKGANGPQGKKPTKTKGVKGPQKVGSGSSSGPQRFSEKGQAEGAVDEGSTRNQDLGNDYYGEGASPNGGDGSDDDDGAVVDPPGLSDADGDGIPDGFDSAADDPLVCGYDYDEDGCDDCGGGYFDERNDGPDADGDGQCDLTDPCPNQASEVPDQCGVCVAATSVLDLAGEDFCHEEYPNSFVSTEHLWSGAGFACGGADGTMAAAFGLPDTSWEQVTFRMDSVQASVGMRLVVGWRAWSPMATGAVYVRVSISSDDATYTECGVTAGRELMGNHVYDAVVCTLPEDATDLYIRMESLAASPAVIFVRDFVGLTFVPSCQQDCAGQWGGSAQVDECGVCGGDGVTEDACDCDGNVLDQCGVCGGDNSSCALVTHLQNGEPNGNNTFEYCSPSEGSPNQTWTLQSDASWGKITSNTFDLDGNVEYVVSFDITDCGEYLSTQLHVTVSDHASLGNNHHLDGSGGGWQLNSGALACGHNEFVFVADPDKVESAEAAGHDYYFGFVVGDPSGQPQFSFDNLFVGPTGG